MTEQFDTDWGVGIQRAYVEKHDTPNSPHREHMKGVKARGSEGARNVSGLSPKQRETLQLVRDAAKPISAYRLGVSLQSLRALEEKGKVRSVNSGVLGSGFSPRTAIEWVAVED